MTRVGSVVFLTVGVALTLTLFLGVSVAAEAGQTQISDSAVVEQGATAGTTDGGDEPRHHRSASVDDTGSQQFDSTTFDVTVYENGSATWTFRHERVLDDADDEAEFERFADEFESEETDFYLRFVEQAETLTETGSEQTDREMEATNTNRSAAIERQLNAVGVVELSFTWENFATADDGAVVVEDVFDRNLFVGSDQTLVVRAGDDLVFDIVNPDGEFNRESMSDSSSVSWSGEKEFSDGHPRIIFENPSADDGTLSPIASNASVDSASWIVPVGAFLSILGVMGLLVLYRSDRLPATFSRPISSLGGPAGSEPTEAVAGASVAGEDLRSDEDRVADLIRDNGGRMKQVDIVEETGWSKSKVSMLLSDMESAGTISKLRVGRENIISLDGFEPEAAKSPFDE